MGSWVTVEFRLTRTVEVLHLQDVTKQAEKLKRHEIKGG